MTPKPKDIATDDMARVFNDRGEILVGALVAHHPRARHRHLRRRLALLSKRAFVSMAVSMS